MLRVAKGNFGAFEKIVFSYQPFMWGITCRLLDDAAEDITREKLRSSRTALRVW